MDKLPKTQQKYFCKHCGHQISMTTGIYGQSQCKQCQNRKFFIDKDDPKEAINKFKLFKKLYPKIKIIVFDKAKLMKEGIDVH